MNAILNVDFEKRCATCGETKPLVLFGVRSANDDGRDNDCIDCRKQKQALTDARRQARTQVQMKRLMRKHKPLRFMAGSITAAGADAHGKKVWRYIIHGPLSDILGEYHGRKQDCQNHIRATVKRANQDLTTHWGDTQISERGVRSRGAGVGVL